MFRLPVNEMFFFTEESAAIVTDVIRRAVVVVVVVIVVSVFFQMIVSIVNFKAKCRSSLTCAIPSVNDSAIVV